MSGPAVGIFSLIMSVIASSGPLGVATKTRLVVHHPLACASPGPRFKVIASSPQATIFGRPNEIDLFNARGCQRGYGLVKIGLVLERRLLRTRGRWVAKIDYGTGCNEDAGPGYYQVDLRELRAGGRVINFSLPGNINTSPVKRISLGASGVFLYAQQTAHGQRLVLDGLTTRRRLATGRAFSHVRIKGRAASWVQNGKHHTATFRVIATRRTAPPPCS